MSKIYNIFFVVRLLTLIRFVMVWWILFYININSITKCTRFKANIIYAIYRKDKFIQRRPSSSICEIEIV